jgi:hypothetical protein
LKQSSKSLRTSSMSWKTLSGQLHKLLRR